MDSISRYTVAKQRGIRWHDMCHGTTSNVLHPIEKRSVAPLTNGQESASLPEYSPPSLKDVCEDMYRPGHTRLTMHILWKLSNIHKAVSVPKLFGTTYLWSAVHGALDNGRHVPVDPHS